MENGFLGVVPHASWGPTGQRASPMLILVDDNARSVNSSENCWKDQPGGRKVRIPADLLVSHHTH
jgi:hypothetical protein